MTLPRPSVLILGTRGIPAAHGGFETFAERLALFLAGRGWQVRVYCQREVERVAQRFATETWRGVELIHVEVASKGPWATLEFDYHCVVDAARRDGVCLVLGYNGAVFLPLLRLRGRPVLTNMDGIEWRRPKWMWAVRTWFWVNEWIAAWSSHRLVADHPVIADHLATRRPRSAIATIPYGGDPVTEAPDAPVRALGLEPGRYLVSIARIEPDNNILTFVEAFARRRRNATLVVLGKLDPANPYHVRVKAAAGDEVLFPGAIYDAGTVKALRFHARAYLHGHSVGGTNPSLVEALWAGSPIIAHDNAYNRGTAGEGQAYFTDAESCERLIVDMLENDERAGAARRAARRQAKRFDWTEILETYEDEIRALGGYAAAPTGGGAPAALGMAQRSR
ncbi:DUF1972 domain-containing protein [Methylobacterium organophilum]|uniref:DUF1972 domain-containing protein n=1 Tax=Methylobacterium organophilum TaxID=410 RepID=UPI001F135802|nr:DUF1972 domain-containing protein [Methylobacterium organophilum]UMY16042.1 DUF1972 domain-containing protein [Methylobacterium organophilum]